VQEVTIKLDTNIKLIQQQTKNYSNYFR